MTRKIFFILLTFLCNCYPQIIKLGGSSNFAIGGNNLGYQLGPAFKIQYEFDNLSCAVQGNLNYYLGDISTFNVATYTDLAFGTTLLFYPFKFAVQPYAGGSVFYNINGMNQEGNQNLILIDKVDNNFSTELLFGLDLTPKDRIHFITEFAYSYHKPVYKTYYRGQDNLKSDGKFNLNTFYLKVGIMVNVN